MKQVLELLDSKIYWYQKYQEINHRFIEQIQLDPEGASEDISYLENNRTSLLNIINSVDKKIQSEIQKLQKITDIFSQEERYSLAQKIKNKDKIINKIIEQDDVILKFVEKVCVESKDKIFQLNKGKNSISKYKSDDTVSNRIDKQA